MTPHQIQLVQASFAHVAPIADLAAGLFYDRLFAVAPHLRPLFRAPMPEQGKKLIAALSLVVNGLDRLDKILPAVEHLAVKHVAYGVEPAHYAVVGEALIWTLKAGLGEGFTLETEEAWLQAYGTLSGAMIAAAYKPAAA
jgi:hemoglobin-like flavoprotein